MRVEITKPIHKATGKYQAWSGVQICSRKEGGVYAIATDGKHLVIVEQDGECDEVVVVGSDVLPRRPVSEKKPYVIFDEDGDLRTDDGVVGSIVDVRFPRVHEALPEITDDYRAVAVNVKSLAVVAGLVGDDDYVVLYIPPDFSAIVVAGASGVGVLKDGTKKKVGFGLCMPARLDQVAGNYREFRRAFVEDYQNALELKDGK